MLYGLKCWAFTEVGTCRCCSVSDDYKH